MKQNILKILTSFKKEGGVYKIDSEELISLMKIISEDRKSARESRIEREKVSRTVERDLNDVEPQEPVDLGEKRANNFSQINNFHEQTKTGELLKEKRANNFSQINNFHEQTKTG